MADDDPVVIASPSPVYDFSSGERHNKRSFNDETYSSDALLGALTELLAPLLRAALADEDKDESTP